MNRIRLLSEQVANQIAAGEVVERPASVVKELVENALDAQASRITVEIQTGGRSLIRVTDDGIGMNRDDALLCLERHATSKITLAEDLQAVQTMGFRGEAVPSIASVSRFSLTTRERDGNSVDGTQVIVNGGKIVEVKSAGTATGTCVEVRQLFFNLPARRKFLRSEETERAHIQHYLMLVALAHPHIAFTLVSDQRTVWQLPPAPRADDARGKMEGLRERLRVFLGADLQLLPVDFSGELEPFHDSEGSGPSAFRVWGFMGAPGVSRSTREDQNLFVNRRPVENRGLNFALMEGYHNALMKGRYPVCCLFLEIDPSEVDVNIHPAKREVKFHREQSVRRLVTQAVRETLMRFHSGQSVIGKVAPAITKEPNPEPTPAPELPGVEVARRPIPSVTAALPPRPAVKPVIEWPARPPAAHGSAPSPANALPAVQTEPAAPAPLPSIPSAPPQAAPLLSVPLRLVGVIGRLYVVFESDRGLVLLDQHAAHERILYEQMLTRLENQGNAPSQRLLLPETVELSPRDSQFLRDQIVTLSRLGVGLSEFGDRTFLLDALPPFVKSTNPRRFVMELVDELKSAGQSVNSLRLGEHMIAKTVCRHAVKANDPLGAPELENLVNDLRRCSMPYTCPHGRPTLIEMSYRELEKKFGRVQ